MSENDYYAHGTQSTQGTANENASSGAYGHPAPRDAERTYRTDAAGASPGTAPTGTSYPYGGALGGGSAYGNTGSFYGNSAPAYGNTDQAYGNTAPTYGDTAPTYGDPGPNYGGRARANAGQGSLASAGTAGARTEQKKSKGRSFVKKLFAAAAIAVVFGVIAGSLFQLSNSLLKKYVGNSGSVSPVITTSKGSEDVYDVSEVVKNVMPAMVSIDITATQTVQNPFSFFGSRSYQQEVQGSGSGIIISQTDTSLFIVTNNHVVEDANTITVTFVNDKTANATVKGNDPDADLAVLEIDLKDIENATLEAIKFAVMGDSEKLQLGEPAIAIGNALGYGQSVTVGHISALQRKVQLTDRTMTLVQTDAAINPGNSGGALLNSKGEVIGINSVKYSSTDVEGIGYAIPISDAVPIVNALVNGTALPESEQAYLGISGVDVTEQYQTRFGLPEGIYIEEVTEGSPAAKGGIKNYDIITSFDGEKVSTMDELTKLMDEKKAGDTVAITVMRSENNAYSAIELEVKLGSVTNKPEKKKTESGQDGGGYDRGNDDFDDFFNFFG